MVRRKKLALVEKLYFPHQCTDHVIAGTVTSHAVVRLVMLDSHGGHTFFFCSEAMAGELC